MDVYLSAEDYSALPSSSHGQSDQQRVINWCL